MKKLRLSSFYLFLFGFIIGVIFYNTLYMYKMENLIKENEILSADLEENLIKLKKLETLTQKKETLSLNNILPIFLNEEEENIIPQDEIEQYIKILLNNQIGKELTAIDVDLIYNGLNNRILKFKDGEYQLEIKSIILTDTMYIKYNVKKIKT
ncbi:hypothetical protein [Defluviitalea phaphyphila]|uniref:hypothetical protein n=1 Tax=Defluviitalea phaphyphila TaxID=1473580 RepID=UPI0007316CCB|nr:hypothetical protein [Defluviitalea phaphyphila]